MDPANNNPTPNEAPAPVAPEAPAAPAAPVPPAAPAVNPDVANAALNPPVNPVVAPTAPAAPGAAPVAPAPAAPAPGAAPAAPGTPATMSMNQMFQPQANANANVFDETTAISVPEGPKAPDPVEEELKAPLKAAGPVPGSIGSAVSMPSDGANNSNVDNPVQGGENPMTANAAPQAKKNSIFDKLMAKTKMSKNTLIILAAVAGVVTIGLIVVLIMVATGSL